MMQPSTQTRRRRTCMYHILYGVQLFTWFYPQGKIRSFGSAWSWSTASRGLAAWIFPSLRFVNLVRDIYFELAMFAPSRSLSDLLFQLDWCLNISYSWWSIEIAALIFIMNGFRRDESPKVIFKLRNGICIRTHSHDSSLATVTDLALVPCLGVHI